MEKTAVQLLRQRLLNDQQKLPIYIQYINDVVYYIDNQLLEMEKQQIIEAVDETNRKWKSENSEVLLSGEQYYNEKYNK